MVDQANCDLVEMMRSWGLYRYQVAAQAGVSISTLQVWLRKPLTDKQRARIMTAVNELVIRK